MKIIQKIKNKAGSFLTRACCAVANKTGSGYVDQGVVILIAVVVGALLLAGLYALFGDVIMPTVTDKIQDLFGYTG